MEHKNCKHCEYSGKEFMSNKGNLLFRCLLYGKLLKYYPIGMNIIHNVANTCEEYINLNSD